MTDLPKRLQQLLEPDLLLERELGGGGMSRVFVATEEALQRRVVVKVLPPELAAGVNIERFRREVQLAAQLQHPHVVPLLTAGDRDGLLWFTMPFIEGSSLRSRLEREGPLPVRQVVHLLHDVVDALAFAHSRGIIHRDIKPENILLLGRHALVTDFGVAKALSAAGLTVGGLAAGATGGGTGTGIAIGTPAYMAPEQLAADPSADHRVDLYAVGLLAYELLTGRNPFSGGSPQATLAAQLTHMPVPPHQLRPDVPEPLSQLVMHCLAKEASDRPESAAFLLASLDTLPPLSTPDTTAQRAATGDRLLVTHRSRLNGWLAGGALLAALFAWGLGTNAWRRQPQATAGVDSLDGRAGDTGVVFRPVADRALPQTIPLVLTHAESLAIAAAVERRQLAQRRTTAAARPMATASPSDREQLIAEVGRIFADSMQRALRSMEAELATQGRRTRLPGAPSGDRPATDPLMPIVAPNADRRLRLVVAPYANATGTRDAGRLTRAVADTLRVAMRAAIPVDRFDVVSETTTAQAVRTMSDHMSIGWRLRADYVVSGFVSMRGDSLVVLTILTDVRTGRFSRVHEMVLPAAGTGSLALRLDPALRQVTSWMDSAAVRAARGRSAPR